MNKDKLEDLRGYYDTTDVAEDFSDATVSADTPSEVLVSTSIRLPQSLMNRIRVQAGELGISATALVRQWITERAADPTEPSAVSVAELQHFITEHAHPTKLRR